MRVRFIKTVFAERAFYAEGPEPVDLHPVRAAEFLKAGYVVLVDEPKVETAAVQPRAEKAARPIRGAQRGA